MQAAQEVPEEPASAEASRPVGWLVLGTVAYFALGVLGRLTIVDGETMSLLAVCKQIVERHGGRIAARPPLGEVGTRIVLTLPRARPRAGDTTPHEADVDRDSA